MKSFIKRGIVAFSISVIALAGFVTDAQAARMGNKRSTGMQRSAEQSRPPVLSSAPAGTQQRANTTAPAAASTAAKPSTASKWMGPIAGIAAGLGLAALFSHLGLGEGLSSLLTMLLLAGVAFFVIRMVVGMMRLKQAGPQAGAQNTPFGQNGFHRSNDLHNAGVNQGLNQFGGAGAAGLQAPTHVVPDEFLRLAKSYFIRLQAANDKKDTDDLRRFLTPEMFAEAQLQIAERGSTTQTTDILELDAVVTSLVTQGALDIGSVRFTGQIQCSDAPAPESFSEVWHFSKVAGVGNEWSLAGIQQD